MLNRFRTCFHQTFERVARLLFNAFYLNESLAILVHTLGKEFKKKISQENISLQIELGNMAAVQCPVCTGSSQGPQIEKLGKSLKEI